MRALVIGGSGLFGKKTVLTLLRDPDFDKVVSLDVVPPPASFLEKIEPFADRFAFMPGDVSRLEQVMNAAHVHGADRIVNWAMILSKAPDPRLNTLVGCLGACNVWEAARLLGIKRVVYASSETVYGEQKDYGDRDIKEDDRLLPFTGSFYALAKCLAEVMADQYHELYGIESTALRPAVGYGHGGKDPKFVRWPSELVSLAAVGKPVNLDCTGDWLFSFVLSDDVAEFTRRALRTSSSPHSAYNLGGPPHSLKDIAAVVKKFIPDAQIAFGSEPENCELPWNYNCDRAREDYGYSVMPLEEAVLRHINEARAEAGLELLHA
jgi:nucleoside-diphosphate-sugar epimerase